MPLDQNTVNTQIAAAHETIERLRAEVARVVVGQQTIVDRLVIALLIRGHVLVEGLPGLAKTLLVKTLASAVDASFKRI
ncbi:MAG TPA: AAA family ATPase, partial [Thermoanaerobaculia bacterium]|nr:AAA family ATPase [Thermoanaerobaculia bacterium]